MNMPKPDINEVSRPYWDALREGHLVVQRCNCGHAWLPARRHCPACLSPDVRWERASGRGRLLSWVIYHTAYHPAFEARLPYNVDPNESLAAEAPVELKVEWEEDVALARFRLAVPAAN
jgi:uncharacterized OB-fold protein